MQQATYMWPGSPAGQRTHKHKLEELDGVDDRDQVRLGQAGFTETGLASPPASNGIKFSEDNLQAAQAFVASAKRRKGNAGQVTLPVDFEPQFEGLSLDTGATPSDLAPLASTSAVPYGGQALPVLAEPSRGRVPAPAIIDTGRGRRDGTPTVTQASSAASHRRRSSSRNRARTGSSNSDTDMKPAPRYDPARPHVVYVDSLSDSESEAEEEDQLSDSDFLSGDVTTPGNSPSSSDADDMTSPRSRSSTVRPIQMNKRLRDHLRKQAMLQRLGHKPLSDGILAGAPPVTGGAGVQERGVVLYRPLSWGIVEEPEEDQDEESSRHTTPPTTDDVRIYELPEDETLQPTSLATDMAGLQEDMDIDDEMEIDE